MNIQQKAIFTIAFIISLVPIDLKWFGLSGVVGISGTIALENPITFICIVTFLVVTWANLKNYIIKAIISAFSLLGIIGVDIYYFFTWFIHSKKDEMNCLTLSFKFAFSGFYIALSASIAMFIFYIIYSVIIYKKPKATLIK